MFCYKCGHKAKDGDRFCIKCGAALNADDIERRTIKLRCEECNGILEVDRDRQILSCPYCGSKKFVQESDEVTIARIDKAKALDEHELVRDKMRHEKEMKEYDEEIREKKNKEDWTDLIRMLGILAGMYALWYVVAIIL